MEKFNIRVKPKPYNLVGSAFWYSKQYGVVLVQKEEDIDPLWSMLIAQDSYWSHYKHLIKVAPKTIENKSEIDRMCEYVGKTDIDDPEEIYSKIPFIMYQISDPDSFAFLYL